MASGILCSKNSADLKHFVTEKSLGRFRQQNFHLLVSFALDMVDFVITARISAPWSAVCWMKWIYQYFLVLTLYFVSFYLVGALQVSLAAVRCRSGDSYRWRWLVRPYSYIQYLNPVSLSDHLLWASVLLLFYFMQHFPSNKVEWRALKMPHDWTEYAWTPAGESILFRST